MAGLRDGCSCGFRPSSLAATPAGTGRVLPPRDSPPRRKVPPPAARSTALRSAARNLATGPPLYAEPCRGPGQRRPVDHMHRPARDRHSQRGTPTSPDKLAGKQRHSDRGDDHDRTRNAHSPQQHHAPSTFAIEKTTLPTRASPLTKVYVSLARISPTSGSRTPVLLP